MRIIPVLLVAVLASSSADAQEPSGHVSATERQALMDLFAATNGGRWTDREGWGTPAPVCDWYGVYCDFVEGDSNRPFVAALSLPFNNLEGEIPSSLGNLSRLRSLDVSRNQLSGRLPERLVRRWDDHDLEFAGEGNRFSDFLVRATIQYLATGVLCAEHDDLRFSMDVDAISGKAVFQSVRCADGESRETYCLVREGMAGSFPQLSRGLKALRFASLKPKYDNLFWDVTHGVVLSTTAVWGDSSQHSVETYNRQGPRDVWVAQQLFLGLLAEASWDRESRKPRCDFEER